MLRKYSSKSILYHVLIYLLREPRHLWICTNCSTFANFSAAAGLSCLSAIRHKETFRHTCRYHHVCSLLVPLAFHKQTLSLLATGLMTSGAGTFCKLYRRQACLLDSAVIQQVLPQILTVMRHCKAIAKKLVLGQAQQRTIARSVT